MVLSRSSATVLWLLIHRAVFIGNLTRGVPYRDYVNI